MRLPALVRFGILIALRRTAADWRLQAAAGFGIVLAVALMASAVIYSNALRQTALEHALRNATTNEVNLAIGVSHVLERPVFGDSSQFVQQRVYNRIGTYLEGAVLFIKTSTFFFTGQPQLDLPESERPRGPIQGVTELAEHVRVLQGRLPQETLGELEVVMDEAGVSLLNLSVGQEFGVFPALLEEAQGRPLTVRIVGTIEPKDPDARYWQLGFPKRYSEVSDGIITVPLYADLEALFNTVGMTFTGLSSDFYWLFFLDRDGLQASEAGTLRSNLKAARGDFFNVRSNGSWESRLSEILDGYTALLTLARIPLFLLVFLAIGVLLYYLFLIASLIGRVRAPEVALFRSRGASLPQVGLVIVLEGLLLAVPAIVLGPFLAQALVLLTGTLFPAATGGTELVLVNIAPAVFLMGTGAGFLAVLVLSITTIGTARHGVVEFRRASARPPQMPFLHRYYLDLVLLALIAMVWFQFKSRGSFLVRPLVGEDLELDLTLLLGPVLGIVAVGLVLFRVFPLLMRAVSLLADPVAPIWLAHGLRRIARDPVPAGSLLVLLALATSLGMMAATFTTTLERNQRERALYEAGADFRLSHSLGQAGLGKKSVADSLRSVPGVAAATDVVRVGSSLIAVEPDSFAQVAWVRPDFTGAPLDELMEKLKPADQGQQGILLPADATALSVWVETGRLDRSFRLLARLQDSDSTYFDTLLGIVEGQGWRKLESPIVPVSQRFRGRSGRTLTTVPPYTLHTLWMDGSQAGSATGVLFLDQLEAVTPGGTLELASFQELERWHPLEDAFLPGLYALELSESVARPGRRSAAFSWPEIEARLRGIRVGPPEQPLRVIVSPSFLPANQAQVGDVLTITATGDFFPVEVMGTADYIPTLDPSNKPFVVVNSKSLIEYLALRASGSVRPHTETWVRSSDGTLTAGVLRQAVAERGGTVSQLYDSAKLASTRAANPLLAAGWAGLLALSFVTVVLASASGLILYTYIDARERSEEFALLRTLGFSGLQVNGVLWFNLTLIVVSGVVMGTWGGQLLGGALLPLLEIAEHGTRVVPPMVLETNWTALGVAYGVLLAATLVTVAVLAWAISHLEIQRLLRAGAG